MREIAKKTWAQKIEDKGDFSKVSRSEKGFSCYNAMRKMGASEGDAIVLVNPSEILPIMAKVPWGRLMTIRETCRRIAEDHDVKGCCSLTT